jgi:hypothetical protein
MTDKAPLLEEERATAPSAKPPPTEPNKLLKYGSLGFLILQNSSQ